jgi:hypothetical protein
MEVKTNVFLNEEDVRAILKKHLEKQGYKVIGELEIIVKKSPKRDSIEIKAEVQKQFKNRISLPNKNP